jgi:hypothetical protein
VSSSNGTANFSNLTLTTPGSYTLTASAPGLTPVTSPAFTVSLPVATSLAFAAALTDSTAGQALPDIQVNVLDQAGNLFTTPAAVTLAANGPGSLTGTVTAQSVNGVATFSGLVLDAAGSYTLTASATGLTSGTSSTFNINPAAAASVTFPTIPANSSAGNLAALNVDVVDAFGNPVAGTSTQVTLTATGPGKLGGTTSLTTTTGVATFSNLTLTTAGSYTLTATATGLTPVTSPSFTISPAAAAQLAFEPFAAPLTVTAGQSLPTVKVDVEDAFGNLVSSSTATVTLGNTASGTMTGTTSTAAASGVASFSGIALDKAGTYSLTASAPGLSQATSAKITVSAAAPTGLSFETLPNSAPAGQAVMNVKVDVVDKFGNVVPSSTSVSIAANGPGAISLGSTTVPAVNGVATFLALALDNPGSYTLTASAAALPESTSPALMVTAGTPSRLVWLSTPAGATAGQTLPSFQVAVYDSFGNPVASGTSVTVTASGPGTLSGSTTAPVVNGVATFSGLSLSAGGTYTLIASIGGADATSSAPFNVAGTTGSTSTVSLGSSSSSVRQRSSGTSQLHFTALPSRVKHGQRFNVKVQLLNSAGRPVERVKVVLHLSGGRDLSGKLTATTSGQGVASFSKLTANKAGHFTLTATAAGQTVSQTLTVQ